MKWWYCPDFPPFARCAVSSQTSGWVWISIPKAEPQAAGEGKKKILRTITIEPNHLACWAQLDNCPCHSLLWFLARKKCEWNAILHWTAVPVWLVRYEELMYKMFSAKEGEKSWEWSRLAPRMTSETISVKQKIVNSTTTINNRADWV